jgi:integrase
MVVLKAAYRDAVADGVVDRSPLTDLKRPARPRPHPTALSDEEVEVLLTVLRTPRGQRLSRTSVYADAMIHQLALGCRLGEVCALRWQDITFDETGATIAITGTVVDTVGPAYRQDEPKTSSGHRVVRIDDPRAIAMLRERDRKAGTQDWAPQVLPAARGGWLHTHVVQQRWRRDLEDSPFGEAGFSTHVLRRTFITNRVDAGASFEQVAHMVGHSDPGTTRRAYYAVRAQVIDLTEDR